MGVPAVACLTCLSKRTCLDVHLSAEHKHSVMTGFAVYDPSADEEPHLFPQWSFHSDCSSCEQINLVFISSLTLTNLVASEGALPNMQSCSTLMLHWSRRFTELCWPVQFRELVIGFEPLRKNMQRVGYVEAAEVCLCGQKECRTKAWTGNDSAKLSEQQLVDA